MSKAEISALIWISLSACVAFGLPHLLKTIYFYLEEEQAKKSINIISLSVYLISVFIFTFIARSEINGTGMIIDPFWAYREVLRRMAYGYRTGGFLEAIRRIRWVRSTVVSLILNILFFVPFGYLVPCNFRRMQVWWKVLLLSFLFSFSIEVLQYLTQRGWFDIADPIYNGVGALIGHSLYKRILYE